MNAIERSSQITERLVAIYPDRRPLLVFESPYQLVIAVILSAQTTDAQVNVVTPGLFARFPTPGALAGAPQREIEKIVHSTGFYRTKARNIIAAAKAIHERFGDGVPELMEDLTSIPGVGRKSANVVRGVVYGLPSIVVDTHLSRVTNRLGLVSESNPAKIEQLLRKVVPEDVQTDFSMGINLHGRYCCSARKPDCQGCVLRDLCPFDPT
ncbi:MAG: endonuclease III [Spirochaetales bacterium]|nr:MAG: endonuclease III [Spirochaetales bacterium]